LRGSILPDVLHSVSHDLTPYDSILPDVLRSVSHDLTPFLGRIILYLLLRILLFSFRQMQAASQGADPLSRRASLPLLSGLHDLVFGFGLVDHHQCLHQCFFFFSLLANMDGKLVGVTAVV